MPNPITQNHNIHGIKKEQKNTKKKKIKSENWIVLQENINDDRDSI